MDHRAEAERLVSTFSALDTCEYRNVFVDEAERKLKKGWGTSDVRADIRNSEEVSPNISEETAFYRGAVLNAKYLHLYLDEIHETRFESLGPLMGG